MFALCLLFTSALTPVAVAGFGPSPSPPLPSDPCNFGPTHHSHLVLPLAQSRADCKLPVANFVLSHGATFFCPHTFDVKLLASIDQSSAREVLCDHHFDSLEKGVASTIVLRPNLPAGGLPALARGELRSWTSPVMYHVHSFGTSNDAGPDDGWNATTIRNEDTTVQVRRVLYGRLLDLQPKPAALTYLAHNGGGDASNAVLSHYISTSGSSGFDHILKATLIGDSPFHLRETWPTFLTVPSRQDDFEKRLASGEDADAILHVYDAEGLPATIPVVVKVTLDYYAGTSDGFAGYGTMCPFGRPHPQSPTTCFNNST